MVENNSHNICAICGREYTGYGNNAYPATIGYCCDECNRTVVVPLRITFARIHMRENLSENK